MVVKTSNHLINQVILIAAVFALSAVIIVLLFWSEPENKPEAQALTAVKVTPFTVSLKTVEPHIRVTGRLQPANRALLRFEVSGQLDQRLVEPGQKVRAGEVLLRLSDADARDSLAEAQARLEMETAAIKRDRQLLKIAAKDVELQQQEVKRLQQLRSESLVSGSKRDQARQKLFQLQSNLAQLRYSVDTAASRLKSARAALARAKRNWQRTQLRAPFDGTVNTVNVEVGDYITPGTVSLEVVDLDNIDLYVEVAGETAAAISLQQSVTVDVNGRAYQGIVIALRRDPDPVTFTHALRIRLQSEDLLPGTIAAVELPLEVQRNVIAVPVSSLLQEDGRNYVFVIQNGRLQRREVERGIRDKNMIIVHSGLTEGEQIVARDIAALTDGQVIELFE